jgi:hypothetical protein
LKVINCGLLLAAFASQPTWALTGTTGGIGGASRRPSALLIVPVAISSAAAPILQSDAGDSTLRQSGLLVQSSHSPKIILRVSEGFLPLDPILVSLPHTNVDRRAFVETDPSNRIKRMVVLQFEYVRPGSSFRFVYPPVPPLRFGGDVYRIGTYIYDDEAEARASPGFEAAATREALTLKGYVVPRLFRTVRLARVASATGSSEIIIFYLEDADDDYPSGMLPGADSDGDLPLTGSAAESLVSRMEASITPIVGSTLPVSPPQR